MYDLARFIAAQDPLYGDVCEELRAGRKQSHWMWFIFPQLRGLGQSPTAQYYGISGIGEAKAYLADTILGPRLRECTGLVNAVEGRSSGQIFGYPDDLKFRSCMTLFAEAADDNAVFREALRKYFGGQPDQRTLDLLGRDSNGRIRKTPSGSAP